MYILYTSASTGKPKGVMGHHQGAVNRLAWMWRLYPFKVEEVGCLKTSINFVDSMWEIFGHICKGIKLVINEHVNKYDPINLINLIAVHKITRLIIVPSLLQSILNKEEEFLKKINCVKQVIVSGEVLPASLVVLFFKKLPKTQLINLYDSTEVGPDASYYEVTKEDISKKRIPIGKPIENMQLYILDANRNKVSTGVAGEIYVGGIGVANGYLNRPELTQERFIKNLFPANHPYFFRTGDLGCYLPDGNVEYICRIDRQIKFHGYRVELDEIEIAIRQ